MMKMINHKRVNKWNKLRKIKLLSKLHQTLTRIKYQRDPSDLQEHHELPEQVERQKLNKLQLLSPNLSQTRQKRRKSKKKFKSTLKRNKRNQSKNKSLNIKRSNLLIIMLKKSILRLLMHMMKLNISLSYRLRIWSLRKNNLSSILNLAITLLLSFNLTSHLCKQFLREEAREIEKSRLLIMSNNNQ